jgi:hypothetical protein
MAMLRVNKAAYILKKALKIAPLLAFLGLLAAAVGCPADGESCSGDFDCPSNPPQACVEGKCQDLGVAAGGACEDKSDCPGDDAHAACIDKTCRIAPACQRIRGDFALIAECDGAIFRGSAVGTNSGCSSTFALQLGGGGAPFASADIVVEVDRENGVTLSGGGDITGCAQASWSAAESRALFEGCPAGTATTCDLGLVLSAAIPATDRACLAGPAIAEQDCVAACESGDVEVGTCRAN